MSQPHVNDTLARLGHRPAVHQLCVGAYVQEPVELPPNALALPLKPLGFQRPAAGDVGRHALGLLRGRAG